MKPRIAISIGDPAGIGPEVTMKALLDPAVTGLASWVVVGNRHVVEHYLPGVAASLERRGDVEFHEPAGVADFEVRAGLLDARCGGAGLAYVTEATRLCLDGEADAMVTAPLNKEAVALSGVAFSGHTEYIAEMCGAPDPRMMLASEELRVLHVTTHVSLREACAVDQARVVRTIELAAEAGRLLGFPRPRIAVCGLNPHAGEHGMFGAEDESVVRPAIEGARATGIDCDGPHAADAIFLKAMRGSHDVVVAMYHDQGHVPMKLIDFTGTVNVTVGIPIIRTSVDHGTAFDIAGKGVADPVNMVAALKLAVTMANNRTR